MPLTGIQGKYIVLFQPAPGLFFLDDLAVKPIGNTMFTPTNTRTDNITPTSATLSWSVRQPSFPTVVVLVDANSGDELRRDTVYGTGYTLTDLEPAKMYQWYVFQTDIVNNSSQSRPVGFATDCVPVAADYGCGFELEEGWQLINGQSSGLKQSLCWTYGDAQRNEWGTATYIPFNQENNKDNRYSYDGSYALSLKATYSARGVSYQPYVAMPATDVTAYDTLQVSFWMRPAYVSAMSDSVIATYTGSTYSKSVIVGTMTDPTDAATFVAIDTVTYDGTLSTVDIATSANNYLFQQMKVELVGATGPYVAFMTSFHEKGSTAQKTFDYIYLDNVQFERKQECKEPKVLEAILIGSTHADLMWNVIDSAASYVLQVSTDPYFADENAFVFDDEVNSNTCRVKGLRPQTTYVWRVRCLCGERWGESSFSQKATFKTSRSPYFLEEFNAVVSASEWTFSKAHADNVVDGTGVLTRGVDNYSFIRTTTNYGLQGSHYAAPGYKDDYHWMVTPSFYLPEEDSVHFSMDLALTACNSAHTPTGNAVTDNDMKDDYYFMIIVSDDGGETWKSENILAKWQNTNPAGQQLRDIATNGQKVRFSLAQYAGKNVRIGLYREARTASSTGITIHVDNVRLAYFDKTIDYSSACQYEDIVIGDVILYGDDTKPGIHAYPTCYYVSDAEAKAGVRDSVHSMEIEVFAAQQTAYTDTICEGESYTDTNFHGKETTGLYRRKMESAHGCDSTVLLNLYVIPRMYAEDEEVAICRGESYVWNDKEYNRAGLFRDTLVSSLGCDSVMTLVISYVNGTSDTVYVASKVGLLELPFTYINAEYPYMPSQAPIYYPTGTAPGVYKDTVSVQGDPCTMVLVHTLTVYNEREAIENVFEDEQGARKLIYRDQLYIIIDDEWYNAAGMKVADPRK